jgi:hypothetical protein
MWNRKNKILQINSGFVGIYQHSLHQVILFEFESKFRNIKFKIWKQPNADIIRLYYGNKWLKIEKPKYNLLEYKPAYYINYEYYNY